MSNKKPTNALDKLRAHLKERGIVGGGKNHDIGCEIQHTGKCNCKELNYKQKPEPTPEEKEREQTLKEVPF